MKTRTLTIRLEADLDRELERACAESGRSRGDLVRDALKRQLSLLRFERLRSRTLPFAEAAGLLTDEDVFRLVS
jgi:predicted transcriptional regulator